ncbi:MAG: SPFH domain-containing protein [Bacteroidota bacterium]
MVSVSVIAMGIAAGIFLLLIPLILLAFYRKVAPGKALIRFGMGGTVVRLEGGMFVLPILHTAEVMDISMKQLDINLEGKDALICKDKLQADIRTTVFVRVNPVQEDIQLVAEVLGSKRASDPKMVHELFEGKFTETLKMVGKRFNFDDLYQNRDEFKFEFLAALGLDLNGFKLDDAVIQQIEQSLVRSS